LKLNIITFAIIVVGAILFFSQALGLPWTTERIIGLGIALPSLLLVLTARVQLGRAFSVRAKATHLVTSGLYSRVRNPIYVFSCLFILGIIIWPDEPWFLLIFAVIMPMQIYRARKESEVLQAKFGAEYLDYKRKTWF
jgi:protein-S-isoprenylcysteine O-methyltransferase Ste14